MVNIDAVLHLWLTGTNAEQHWIKTMQTNRIIFADRSATIFNQRTGRLQWFTETLESSWMIWQRLKLCLKELARLPVKFRMKWNEMEIDFLFEGDETIPFYGQWRTAIFFDAHEKNWECCVRSCVLLPVHGVHVYIMHQECILSPVYTSQFTYTIVTVAKLLWRKIDQRCALLKRRCRGLFTCKLNKH